jgi:hypothetical protein
MQLQLSINFPYINPKIEHTDKILLVGSCFTEHMSSRLLQGKWNILANPNGILFNPLSVADAIRSYVENRIYTIDELFYWNELWQHWDFHSQFSNVDAEEAIISMNSSIEAAHNMIYDADWLIITLGSSFQYFDIHQHNAIPVANCHRAPGQWFDKRLLSIETIVGALQKSLDFARSKNSKLKVLFTISPVRHIRDGVVENNRSKARLIEAVHSLVEQNQNFVFYFPAYELAIDVLRDYRFFDIDMVHPNYACTQYIWEAFTENCLSENAQTAYVKMKEVNTAFQHRTRFPNTLAHQKFLDSYAHKIEQLSQLYPYVNFTEELNYFKIKKP